MLTREECLAGIEAAEVYPKGFGGSYYCEHLPSPDVAIGDVRGGKPFDVEGFSLDSVHDDIVQAVGCVSWREYIDLLDLSPPTIAMRLKEYLANTYSATETT